ncbi:sigma factor-like helix-turn-helix DNA-binding protein [Cohnella lubricantis]|uniref:Sigma-70 family RNA polymerase sigma factor n=1 Tax=Cohnella lubricantis TaxID=2163172 RepID=A0A841THT7_9BACL|nr:sigma factor-like helix-turn-helix DNA-binding protein [Cohnella lubricantis]MBB6679705.1 hypothetical protein [Cohnella lubricantis]MBP2119373.1 hypothetical protein [Cohnella lubricantis]
MISYAFLVLLEKLGCDYKEIASLIGKSEANCRQLYSRSKRQLAGDPAVLWQVQPERERSLANRFAEAFSAGRTEELVRLLTEDAVMMTDGGGKVHAAINPIYGRARSLAMLGAMAKRSMRGARFEETPFAGGIGLAVWRENGSSRLCALIGTARKSRFAVFTRFSTRISWSAFDRCSFSRRSLAPSHSCPSAAGRRQRPGCHTRPTIPRT